MENVLVKKEGHIATVSLNRTKVLNAFNSEMLADLTAAIKEAGKDPEVYVIILNSSIDKAFTAGGDIKEAIRHAEKALILDHSNVLCDNTASTKSYCYDELYRIYNEGDIFELKPIVDMNDQAEL